MKIVMILLILPVLVAARIDIDVIASEDKSEREVRVSGSLKDVVSYKEIDTFQLHERKLKEAITSYYGANPTSVYVKSPTPWNDLYTTYGWKQVTRILKPVQAKILSVKYQPVLVFKQYFNNTSSMPSTYKAYIRQEVEDTVASFWTTYGELAANLNISYGFDIKAMAVNGKATMSYVSRWGENTMKSQTVTVGSETGLEIVLQPKQRAKAELYATRGAIQVQIDYEASLEGTLAVNYAEPYKGHHFYSMEVNTILDAGGINKTVHSSEVITMGYYSDSEVVLQDVDTNDVLNYS